MRRFRHRSGALRLRPGKKRPGLRSGCLRLRLHLEFLTALDSLSARCYTPARLEKLDSYESYTITSPSSLYGQAHGIADVACALARGLVENDQSFFVNVSLYA